jgi:hypothetical protein
MRVKGPAARVRTNGLGRGHPGQDTRSGPVRATRHDQVDRREYGQSDEAVTRQSVICGGRHLEFGRIEIGLQLGISIARAMLSKRKGSR